MSSKSDIQAAKKRVDALTDEVRIIVNAGLADNSKVDELQRSVLELRDAAYKMQRDGRRAAWRRRCKCACIWTSIALTAVTVAAGTVLVMNLQKSKPR
jgi:hypothetical protein